MTARRHCTIQCKTEIEILLLVSLDSLSLKDSLPFQCLRSIRIHQMVSGLVDDGGMENEFTMLAPGVQQSTSDM